MKIDFYLYYTPLSNIAIHKLVKGYWMKLTFTSVTKKKAPFKYNKATHKHRDSNLPLLKLNKHYTP